jgi:hypothetical protein
VRTLALAVAIALLALAMAACGGESDAGGTVTVPTAGEPVTPEPARERAPAIAGASLDGDPISLADLRGQAVLINVWSSW